MTNYPSDPNELRDLLSKKLMSLFCGAEYHMTPEEEKRLEERFTEPEDRKVICGYCGNRAELISSIVVYRGRDFGPLWRCEPCDAYVGVHRGTTEPLGTLANAKTREARKRAHEVFDASWARLLPISNKSRRQIRNEAYAAFSEFSGIPREKCHIGMFDEEQCDLIIRYCTSHEKW